MLKKRIVIPLMAFAVGLAIILVETSAACTIGVASGRATANGRPMIWKSRDSGNKNNEVTYSSRWYKYKFIAVTNADDTRTWQGVNEKGLCILNSISRDLGKLVEYPSDNENGAYMRKALGYCATVNEFEELLKNTNFPGRETMANYAVMDATGDVAIFETASKKYWKFDATDPGVAPDGYIVRSNFAFSVDPNGNTSRKKSFNRYKRASDLTAKLYADRKLTYKDILRVLMRDFSDINSRPITIPFDGKPDPNVPFGYINDYYSICRDFTVSTSLFVGVLPSENPRLTTMWTILGQPATSIAVPCWPVGKTPTQADGKPTAPLCDTALKIKSLLFDSKKRYIDTYKLRDAKGNGLFNMLFPAEDKIFAQTEAKLAKWRKTDPEVKQMLQTQEQFAAEALDVLNKAYNKLKTWTPDRTK